MGLAAILRTGKGDCVWLLLRFGSGAEGSTTGTVTRYFQGEGTAGEGQRQICARDYKWAALFRKSRDKDVTKGWRTEGEELRATDASHRPALPGNPGDSGALPVLLSSSWQGSMQPLQEHPRCFSVLTARRHRLVPVLPPAMSSEAGGLQHSQVGD